MPISVSNISPVPSGINSVGKETPAMSVYDDIWGFYTFGQTVSYNYDDMGMTGLSEALIVINGFFTHNAESSNSNSDSIMCNKLLSKYGKLRKILLATVNKAAPDDVSHIGTSDDERCVKLPRRLKDNNGDFVYAIPISFSTTEISPQILRYTAQFKEPIKAPCKLTVNRRIINDATVSIMCRKPRITYRTFAFASGSEAHVTGIDNRRYSISGDISEPYASNCKISDLLEIQSNSRSISGSGSISSFGINGNIASFIHGIILNENGVINVGAMLADGSYESNSISIMITEHTVSTNFVNGSTHIEISGEETSNSGS